MSEIDREIDASGLHCPLPLLRARKALESMDRGQVLRVISTDQGSMDDFEAYANQTKNPLLSADEKDGKFVFVLRKR